MRIPTSRRLRRRRATLRGNVAIAAIFWLIAIVLFVLPFLRSRAGAEDTTAAGWVDWPRTAINNDELAEDKGQPDLPWSDDVAYFLEDFETDLTSPLEEHFEQWFPTSGLVDTRCLESASGSTSSTASGATARSGTAAVPPAATSTPGRGTSARASSSSRARRPGSARGARTCS